jgi:hypothetical protein
MRANSSINPYHKDRGKNAFQQNSSRYFKLLATEKMQYLPEKNP